MSAPGYCVVGLGAHARTKILPALTATGHALVGVVTSSDDAGGAAQGFTSLDDALATLPRETIYFLATPPELHAAQAQKILSAGSDLFVEKPAFAGKQDAARLAALSGPQGPILVEAFMYRHTRLFERLMDFWAAEKTGIRAIALRFVIPQMPSGTFRSRTDIAASSLFDIGCYPLSLLQGLGIDLNVLSTSRVHHAGQLEQERLEITGNWEGRELFIEVGVGPTYVNEARFQHSGGTTFAPIFYGRPGMRTITTDAGSETLEDHNGFEAMFGVQRNQWLATQLERSKAMVYQAAQLEILGGELLSIRNNALSKDH